MEDVKAEYDTLIAEVARLKDVLAKAEAEEDYDTAEVTAEQLTEKEAKVDEL